MTHSFLINLCLSLGTFDLGVPVDALFFIGSQLVATSHTGKIGVWNSMSQHWQVKHTTGPFIGTNRLEYPALKWPVHVNS